MNQDYKIQSLDTIEYLKWLHVWQQYQQFYQASIAEDVSIKTWEKLIEPTYTQMYGYAAVKDGVVMGIVHVIEHESCWTLKPYAYLQDLFVDPSERGQGVARSLIEQVYTQAMQRQCDRVYWLTQESNHLAQQLYDKVAKKTGFIQYKMI